MATVTQHQSVALASRKRRLAGFIIDQLILNFTVGVGWLIWFLIIAGRAQTPAKQLLSLCVVREDGRLASYGWMLLREIVVKFIIFIAPVLALGVIGAVLGGAAGTAFAFLSYAIALIFVPLWCVWDKNRQALWDKAVRTLVIHDPEVVVAGAPVRTESSEAAENLRTLAEMRDRGLLTDAEYEERRQRELERL